MGNPLRYVINREKPELTLRMMNLLRDSQEPSDLTHSALALMVSGRAIRAVTAGLPPRTMMSRVRPIMALEHFHVAQCKSFKSDVRFTRLLKSEYELNATV